MTETEKRVVLEDDASKGSSGETHFYGYVKIKESGDLEIGASDTGDYPSQMVGGDYEYWVEVPASAKDDLLLALIERSFKGQKNPVDTFRDFVKEKGIPHEFKNWVWIDRD